MCEANSGREAGPGTPIGVPLSTCKGPSSSDPLRTLSLTTGQHMVDFDQCFGKHMWPFKSKLERRPTDLVEADASVAAKLLNYYPNAFAAADLVQKIEERIAANPSFRYG